MMLIEFEGDLYIKKYQPDGGCSGCYFLYKYLPHPECCDYEDNSLVEFIFIKIRRDNMIIRYTKILFKKILIGSNSQWRKY